MKRRDEIVVGATILVGLAVVVDADSMLLRPHYRAEEDTLQVLTRVAAAVRRGRGHRCLIQTRMAQHRVMQALRHGNGEIIVAEWLAERRTEQLPPFGELLAVELTPADAAADSKSSGRRPPLARHSFRQVSGRAFRCSACSRPEPSSSTR